MAARTGTTLRSRLSRKLRFQKYLLLMCVPAFTIVLIFHYIPIYGITIAFKDFIAARGIHGSPWVGFKHFSIFFQNPFWWRITRNSLLLGFYSILFAFPAPIILALLFNELKSQPFKRVTQTISYFPNFVSTVIIVGMLKEFAGSGGLFNQIRNTLGLETILYFTRPQYFRPLFIGSDIWQGIGFGTILYLAALSTVDPTLYDVAVIDGANRWQRVWRISIPSISPTIIILLILRMGSILAIDWQKVLLMYHPGIYETADVIGTFVYREGIEGARFSYTAAVGLMQNAVAFVLLVLANQISKSLSETSLW